MLVSLMRHYRSTNRRPFTSIAAAGAGAFFEPLEGRQLLAVTLGSGAAGSALAPSSATTQTTTAGTGTTPASPFALSATATSPTTVNIQFYDNSNDETNFTIVRTGGGATSSFNVPAHTGANPVTYTDTTAQPSTTYSYTVQAFNGDRGSNVIGPATATTPPSGGGGGTGTGHVTARPFALTATATGPTTITFQFYDNSDDETAYAVRRSTSPSFTSATEFMLPAHPGHGYVTFNDTGLSPGTTYYYTVDAVVGDVRTPATETAQATTPTTTTHLPAPVLSTPANNATGVSTSPQFSWSQVAGNNGYRIIVSSNAADLPTDPNQSGTTPVNGFNVSVSPNTTSFTPLNPSSANTTYYWEVHAVGTDSSTTGVWSNQNKFTTGTNPTAGHVTARPFALSATATSPTTVTFQFYDNSDDETSFLVSRTSGSSPATQFTIPAHPGHGFVTFNDSGLTPSTTYTYTVAAMVQDVATPANETAQVTTPAGNGLDTTFGSGGKVIDATKLPAVGLFTQSDGKVVVATQGGVTRYNPDGTVDSSYGTNGTAASNFTITDIAVAADGRAIVVGRNGDTQSGQIFFVEELDYNGTPLSTFGSNGVAMVQFPNSVGNPHVSIDHNGRIIVAGTGFNGTGLYGPEVARFTANGTLDTTFNSTGVYSRLNTSQVRINDVATDLNNRVVLVGENVGGSSGSFHVERLSNQGQPDGTLFAAPSSGSGFDSLESVTVQSNGQIVAVGEATQVGVVLRFNDNGTIDGGFGAGGEIIQPLPSGFASETLDAVYEDSAGRIIVGGTAQSPSGTHHDTDFLVARYTPNGTADTTFASNGIRVNDLGGNDVLTSLSNAPPQSSMFYAAGGTDGHLALVRYLG